MSTKRGATTREKTIEETYLEKTDHEHVLDLPDSYIGSVTMDGKILYVLDEVDDRPYFVKKTVSYIPGLYKIFDEIIVNARDRTIKDPSCTEIRVAIQEDGSISVANNGLGIPIVEHKGAGMY